MELTIFFLYCNYFLIFNQAIKSVDFVEKTEEILPISTNSTLSIFLYLFPTDLLCFLFDCFSQQEWEMCQIVWPHRET